jgi:uridine phosphorylase
VPAHLRPTAAIATDAVLVGDPGRALLLAQELLEEPKMSNHARGLWGYSGQTPGGAALTIQATGIGGPSAALVLGDLAELGVRRVVRVGTCAGSSDCELGELLLVSGAVAAGGSITSLGVAVGEMVPASTASQASRRHRRASSRPICRPPPCSPVPARSESRPPHC